VSWPSLQKGFFCQPFFEKIQGLGFPELFLTKMVFLKRYKVFRRKTCVVALPSKTLGRDTRLENLCRGPPFKNFGKGYQVRKLVS